MRTLRVLISQIEIGCNFPRPELEVEMWGGGMGFISAESRRQAGKWKIIPIERLIIIIIIILFSFQNVCWTRPFHRDMNGSNELSHILFQLPFLLLQDPHPRPHPPPAHPFIVLSTRNTQPYPTTDCALAYLRLSRSLHVERAVPFLYLGKFNYRDRLVPTLLQLH